ncbi:hypothetical protein AVEN_241004-1 [Araneus ventricosus]|uniref:Uncharacterized protein n=1 Tax=Araneus ventricosus TaxID=182803 RepID=A0A4Y2N675_ARAVE|nr:hypothetical protein AVEN_241004-1 [Araneus ventricosus]
MDTGFTTLIIETRAKLVLVAKGGCCGLVTVGLGVWGSGTKRAGRLGESRIYSEAFHDALLWKLHSLLAGIHSTRPCGSQLPSAGGFNRLAWRRQQALQ